MKRKTLLVMLIATVTVAVSCGVTTKSRLQQLPATLPPASYPHTLWLSTMQQAIEPGKNAVYASLPLVWPSVEQQFGKTVNTDEPSQAFNRLAHAVDHNTIHTKQFQSVIHQKGDKLFLTASLDVSLRFEPHFETFLYKMVFENIPVRAFGMSNYSFHQLRHKLEIHRYRDNDHFILGLLPTDRSQQVLLYRTDKKYPTLAAMYADQQDEIQHGRADMTVPDRLWRYSWTPYDRVAIPRITLGVEGTYPQLTGSIIQNGDQQLTLASIQQTVAFLLNETGTKLAVEWLAGFVGGEK
ncbi:hypothetical protein [Sphingobacterium sp. FBM7-1]|uniref:hypothetical protein n=1 Tax=Sphingobacterium sp. FBM7-1 TaxID=2886688 RepID=UPI001D1207E5|nr:hypothetical protein [Sphingobacterium sp. FBM7-1]MCC2599659.1 hypothetical protein [Sphingobacterium sp. FBM7-1]